MEFNRVKVFSSILLVLALLYSASAIRNAIVVVVFGTGGSFPVVVAVLIFSPLVLAVLAWIATYGLWRERVWSSWMAIVFFVAKILYLAYLLVNGSSLLENMPFLPSSTYAYGPLFTILVMIFCAISVHLFIQAIRKSSQTTTTSS